MLPGVSVDRILAMGRETDPSVFNMAHLGLRLAQRANGVSKLHGEVSRAMFAPLWPGFDAAEVPIGSVTNGVHAPTWAAREWIDKARELIGDELVEEARGWERLCDVDLRELWSTRNALRGILVDEVRRRLRNSWLERGAAPAELGWVDQVFDPNVLTVGFARRVPTYKRLTLMLRDPDRLRAMLLDPERPVQLVVAGKSHPADDGGKALIQQIVRFADDPAVRHRIVFLPDYDMSMARYLYWGCDVWLNNPLRPLEACGTSGMKSALNGGLNLSIRDGWWDEMYDGENGWSIPTADGVRDEHRRDDLEASALYELLERAVLPRFYDRDHDGLPVRWMEMVRHTLRTLGPQVLASRMVRDYAVDYYAPTASAYEALSDNDFKGARELSVYRRRVESAWPSVKVLQVDSSGLPDTPVIGADLALRARIDLGGLTPADVTVQAVLGRVSPADDLTDVHAYPMRHHGTDSGAEVFTIETPVPISGAVGYTIRILPHHPCWPPTRSSAWWRHRAPEHPDAPRRSGKRDECPLEDLAGGVARQRVQEGDVARDEEAADAVADVVADHVGVQAGAGALDDESGQALAEFVIGHADHRHLGDLRQVRERLLDGAGEDVLAAGDDHLVVAPGHEELAGGIEIADVAGVEHAVGLVRRGRVGVAVEEHVIADEDAAGRAHRHRTPIRAQHGEFRAQRRAARRGG